MYGASQEDYRNLRQSTAVVYNSDGSQGSGFFITENLLVTNYHIIRSSVRNSNADLVVGDFAVDGLDFENVMVQLRTLQGEDIGRVLVIDSQNDLAIIQTSKDHYKPLVLGSDIDISRGKKIFSIGYPIIRSADPKAMISVIAEGTVGTQMGSELFHMTAFGAPGSSGSPVFSTRDLRVIGIVVGGLSEQLKDRYAFALPISKLKTFIENHRDVLEREWGARFYHEHYPTVSEKVDKYLKSAEDMFRLGLAYEYDIGSIGQSNEEALFWYERAGYRGHVIAQFYAGLISHQMNQKTHSEHKRSIIREEYERTLYWVEKAANQGHVDAMYWAGYLYYINLGKIGVPDYQRAFYWFEKAAKQGHVKARYNYAIMLYEGRVGPPQIRKAREEFKALADQGHDRARIKLLMIDGKDPVESLQEWAEQKKTPCPF